MAFQFGSAGSSGFGSQATSSSAQTQTGPDLEEIQTEALGFASLAGEAKVQLLPSAWPSNALPPPTASLLSIASKKGLLAAAGPESVVLAATELVRQAFSARGNTDGNIKPFTPQLTLSIGTRVSQLAFSADEEYLVISAENGGGLAVYEVQSVMQGQTTSAFELATNGASLRSLVQNPTPGKAELFAVITNKGDLMMANLKNRAFLNAAQGQVWKSGVSCVSWSTKGKALVAGLGDGTCYQIKSEGDAMAEIPKPPGMEGDYHVASISWIENNIFLAMYNITAPDDPMAPETTFYLITREKNQGPFLFQKLPELCPPFGLERKPPHYFMQRLKDFPPNIQDIVLVASTASGDLGMFSRSKTPLASDIPAERITNVFTTTTMANDARRGIFPMSESMEDTSPIGVVMDLSVKEKVLRPLPGEEMDTSSGPVPALLALNNEGVLSGWYIIYADSIRQGTTYPGLVSEGNQATSQPQTTTQPATFGSTSGQPIPTFGQNTLGAAKPTVFVGMDANRPSTSMFGGGQSPGPAASSTFGAPSTSGTSSSPWTSSGFNAVNTPTGPSAFGKPSFGSASTIGSSAATPAFGSTGGIGNQGSVWGGASSGKAQTGGSVFGQSAGLGTRPGSVSGAAATGGIFGALSTPAPPQSQGGFASFAKGNAFLSATSQAGGESPFAKAGAGGSFSSTMDTDTSFGATPQKKADSNNNISSSGFTLGSTFTKDNSGPPDLPKPANSTQSSMFGGGLGKILGEVEENAPQAKSEETDMPDEDSDFVGSESSEESAADVEARTPAGKPSQPSGGIGSTTTPRFGGLFGTQSQAQTTPAAVQSSTPAPSIFGKGPRPTTTPAETPQKQQDSSPLSAQTPPSPPIKPELDDQETPIGVSKSIPEAPLPPESTSKVSYAAGDSSNSSKSSADDAQLPPDFLPSKSKLDKVQQPPTGSSESSADDGDRLPPDFLPSKVKPKIVERQPSEEAPLPADDGDDGLDDEGSGVDVAQEVSPTSDSAQSPRMTPSSSFGASFGPSPVSSVFSKPQQPRQSVKSLFGEVSSPNVPSLPPPSRTQQSPRSPSPIRLAPPGGSLRPDNARSISAPNRPPIPAAQQRGGKSSVAVTPTALPTAQEQRRQERDSLAARRAKQQAEEEQDLSDHEDVRVREELEAPVEPTKTLDEFLAHQDYVGGVTKPGIPGQIEKVYRDINSMVDTLGLNARALEGFMKGHQQLAKDGGRSLDDLDDPDWCLVEMEDLEDLEGQLHDQLAQGRIQDVQGKLDGCRDIRKDLSKLRTRRADIKKVLTAAGDEEKANAIKYTPLTASQSQQQHDLRKGYAKVQKLIAEAEANITLLRANLASHDKGDGQTAPLKKPTVEAVTNTIRKMTSMVEKKSGDIDLLESQMRKLRFSPAPHGTSTSREGSPSLAASSPGIKSPVGPSALRHPVSGSVESPLRRSIGGTGSPKKKKMSGVTAEEVERYRAKMGRRREVNRIMKEAFAKAGPRHQALE